MQSKGSSSYDPQPQFTLKTLFWLMAVVAAFLAGAVWLLVVMLVAAIVLAVGATAARPSGTQE